jgi:hypothetical protein
MIATLLLGCSMSTRPKNWGDVRSCMREWNKTPKLCDLASYSSQPPTHFQASWDSFLWLVSRALWIM